MIHCPAETIEKLRIKPEKIFVSHSGEDKEIIEKIESVLQSINLLPYIAERRAIGIPLVNKLREEMADSNMTLIVWTKNAKEKSSEIIGFETGMAWINRLPIFILKDSQTDIKWFYEQLTDYVKIEDFSDEKLIQTKLDEFDFTRYKNPICFCFPRLKTPKGTSLNEKVVQPDGTIRLWSKFKEIVHFFIGNHTNRIIRDIRVDLLFPDCLKITFNPGDLSDGVQRNEMFEMKQVSAGRIRVMMMALPSDEHWSFEVNISATETSSEIKDSIFVKIQGGEYSKKEIIIPFIITPQET